MTTSARLCASCGSPLPEVPPGVRQVKCQFCGVVNDIAAAGAAPITIAIDRADATRVVRRVGGVVAIVIFVSVAAALAAAGFGVYVAMRAVSEAAHSESPGTSSVRSIPAGSRRRSVAPADLPKTGGGGWQTLDVAPPSSGWAAFEPVADLNWAMAVARAWQQDARVMRIDVSRLTPQGTVNLAGTADDSAMYRFESPSQIEEWKRSARGGDANPQVGHELMLKLSQQAITALVGQGKPSTHEQPPPAVDSVPLLQLMSTARRTPAFAQPSFFDGYMIYNEREGWVWYLTGRGFDESLPRLRARDGAAYPYR
jgi:LSD1 subclass zinc finger protein